ncbi:MAG: TIGR02147 family protein [Pseudomonadota bacterium]
MAGKKPRIKPNIFKYDNYRTYLRDWFNWMKATKHKYSYRLFSKEAGFKSPNQLMLVMNGQRNVTMDTLQIFCETLGLAENESKYFELLVKFNQAKDMPSKTRFFKELSVYWMRSENILKKEQYRYLSNWFYTAIREMVVLKDFQEDGNWIAKKLDNLISPAQAEKAIQALLDLKLLKRTKNGKLVQTSIYTTTGDEVRDVAAYIFHEQMIKMAAESLKQKDADYRNISSLTFTIRPDDYNSLVEKINLFRKEIVNFLNSRNTLNEDKNLYQFSLHLFPIGEVSE